VHWKAHYFPHLYSNERRLISPRWVYSFFFSAPWVQKWDWELSFFSNPTIICKAKYKKRGKICQSREISASLTQNCWQIAFSKKKPLLFVVGFCQKLACNLSSSINNYTTFLFLLYVLELFKYVLLYKWCSHFCNLICYISTLADQKRGCDSIF